jgi:hypothetical protein
MKPCFDDHRLDNRSEKDNSYPLTHNVIGFSPHRHDPDSLTLKTSLNKNNDKVKI